MRPDIRWIVWAFFSIRDVFSHTKCIDFRVFGDYNKEKSK